MRAKFAQLHFVKTKLHFYMLLWQHTWRRGMLMLRQLLLTNILWSVILLHWDIQFCEPSPKKE
ncbi:hypothetical protein DYQ91_18635 [Xanthomonas sp. LMG 8989]|nr:hypothetical protein [Xanthomonas sp. LMG 8989]